MTWEYPLFYVFNFYFADSLPNINRTCKGNCRFRAIMNKVIIRKPNRLLNTFLKYSAGLVFKFRYRLHHENRDIVKQLEPPYLLLPNHVSLFDPVLISLHIPHPVSWVASDPNFTNPLAGFFLRRLGTIPKTKGVSDLDTVRMMIETLNRKGVVGVFAEGERTWDGQTLPVLPATAKLVRLLKIPVVVPIIKGSFLVLPRWAEKKRRGPVTIEYRLAVSREEAGKLSLSELQERLDKNLNYNEFDYQRNNSLTFHSKELTEGLSRTLFICPGCKGINTMYSLKDLFTCDSCGFSVKLTHRGFFETRRGDLPFDDIHEWYVWQLEYFRESLRKALMENVSTVLFDDRDIQFSTGYKTEKRKRLGFGKARMYADRIELELSSGEVLKFPLNEISGDNVVYRDQFEFYYNKTLYSFTFTGRPTSGIKWHHAVTFLKSQ